MDIVSEEKQNKQELMLLAKLSDLVKKTQSSGCAVASGFLDPLEMTTAQRYLRRFADVSVFQSGGYPGAERAVLFLCPEWVDAETEFWQHPPIKTICVSWPSKFYNLTHRDFLGAILGLGLRRDQIGDILVGEGSAQIMVAKGIAVFTAQQLQTVGRAPVKIKEQSLEEIRPPGQQIKEIRTTVASPRLDSLLGAAFGMSRSRALPLILANRVQVNYQAVADPSCLLQVGAMISVQGLGRARLASLPGKTKKGRLVAVLERLK